ncbi:hypothetical protein NX059_004728 [Plenodomus lindquistii]|nr:hypothetical protein NX059_004728 [Plenodomus lindquistii]
MFQSTFIAILALSATSYGVAFNGLFPTPTITTTTTIDANGWTPKPTSSPLHPRNQDQAGLCGYIEGLASTSLPPPPSKISLPLTRLLTSSSLQNTPSPAQPAPATKNSP